MTMSCMYCQYVCRSLRCIVVCSFSQFCLWYSEFVFSLALGYVLSTYPVRQRRKTEEETNFIFNRTIRIIAPFYYTAQ